MIVPSMLLVDAMLRNETKTANEAESQHCIDHLVCDVDFYLPRQELRASLQSPEEDAADLEYIRQNLYRTLRIPAEHLMKSPMKEPVA